MTISSFFCLLSHESILSIQGNDSKKFLQGQLTCNLNYLSVDTSSLGGCCTPKGRLVSSFRLIEKVENHYFLTLDKQLYDKQLADFKKYAIFSKVTFSLADNDWSRFGLYATEDDLHFLNIPIPQQINQVTQADGLLLIKTSHQLFELWVTSAQTEATIASLSNAMPEETLNTWLLMQIQAGIGQVFAANTEHFVPQMINLQSLGGVSFKKGCYIGQEIVARMQFLGKLKQHLYRFSASINSCPPIGTEIFSTVHSTSVGQVVLAATTPNNTLEILASVRDDAAVDKLWLAGNEDNPLTLLTLPYQVNPDEEIKH